MILFPLSKINIGLNITGRRPDGYHDLETVMVKSGWTDILEIVPSRGSSDSFTATGRHIDCSADDNLVMKAVKLLRRSGIDIPAVDIGLHKIVPHGAGLGGGSADAAATVVGLCDMFAPSVPTRERAALAAELGSDCPFFVYRSGAMLATGRGERLRPVDVYTGLEQMTLVIVKPAVCVSTREAYSQVVISPNRGEDRLVRAIKKNPDEWRSAVVNGFEKSVFALHPEIADIKERLYSAGAVYASMSGSGAAVYGLFADGAVEAGQIEPLPGGCDIYIGKLNLGV